MQRRAASPDHQAGRGRERREAVGVAEQLDLDGGARAPHACQAKGRCGCCGEEDGAAEGCTDRARRRGAHALFLGPLDRPHARAAAMFADWDCLLARVPQITGQACAAAPLVGTTRGPLADSWGAMGGTGGCSKPVEQNGRTLVNASIHKQYPPPPPPPPPAQHGRTSSGGPLSPTRPVAEQ